MIDASKDAKVVIVAEAYHAAYDVALRPLILMTVDVGEIDLLWEREQSLQDWLGAWWAIWPIHIERQYLGRISGEHANALILVFNPTINLAKFYRFGWDLLFGKIFIAAIILMWLQLTSEGFKEFALNRFNFSVLAEMTVADKKFKLLN